MKIQLTLISPTHHRLLCTRENASHVDVELETKSFFLHDLLHFAAESVGGVQEGFWGSLASGKSIKEINLQGGMGQENFSPTSELDKIEVIVGVLTGAWKAKSPDVFLVHAKHMFESYGKTPPPYLTPEYAKEVFSKLHQILGEWNSLRFGESLELTW